MAGGSRARRIWAVACVLATAAVLFMPAPGSAFFQSSNIVITLDRSGYRVGDFANVTMRVFSFGVLTDPDSMTLRLNPGTPAERTVNVTRQALGIYNATLQIQPSDAGSPGPYSSGTIPLLASAGIGSLLDVETAFLQVLPQSILAVSLTASATEASPGGTVDLFLQTTIDGVPHDVDQISVIAYLSVSSGSAGSVSVPAANASTGNYTATYQVPAGLTPPALVNFVAVATISGHSAGSVAYVFVPGTEPFQIWAYQSTFAPPTVTFTVFVGDSAGGFVGNANVSLNYTYSSASTSYQEVTRPASTHTDAYGRASFSLDLGGVSDVLDVLYAGNVTKGGGRQGFAGVLYARSSSLGASFQIVRTNPYASFDVNATAQLNYTVLALGTPVAGTHVYYYAQTDTEFLAAGNVTSDAGGHIRLSVPIRVGANRILLTANTGTTWYSTLDYVFPAHPLVVETDPIRVGARIRVNVTFPTVGPWSATAYFVPYDEPMASSLWSPVSGLIGATPSVATGTAVSYNLTLPRFLPKDTDYVLVVSAVPASPAPSGAIVEGYAYSQIVHITNVPAEVQANLSTTTPAVGDGVAVNASLSEDPDGFIVGYRVDWGDGNVTDWASSPLASHAYASPGDHRVSVAVKDDSGAVSVTQTTVHVEGVILGLRDSLAIPLFLAVGLAAAAIVAAVWWRRRRRPSPAPPPEETAPAAAPQAEEPDEPQGKAG